MGRSKYTKKEKKSKTKTKQVGMRTDIKTNAYGIMSWENTKRGGRGNKDER